MKSSEEEEMKRILFELSQEVKKHGDALIANCETLALLDCIFAKAHYAHEIQGCVATLNDERHIYMKKARHPLIDPKKVVANTYEMKDNTVYEEIEEDYFNYYWDLISDDFDFIKNDICYQQLFI